MPRKKGTKKAGDQVGFKLKEDESPLILEWVNEQSIFAESIRYLIEKEIAENGIRDLKQVIKQGFSYYRHAPIRNPETIEKAAISSPVKHLSNNKIEKNEFMEPAELKVSTQNQNESSHQTEVLSEEDSPAQTHLTERPQEVLAEEEDSTIKDELGVQQEETNEQSPKQEDSSEEKQDVHSENDQLKEGPKSARRRTNLFG
ncbi:hypothetical protein ACFOU2_00120 [Bacillus songklensis]|uniref:Uncharacterized protein n=1 Tax=Bacillus songklensis TaxID=1069116 RepID=A0ABV8AYJ1_9BACI